jgi:hypothetical protein
VWRQWAEQALGLSRSAAQFIAEPVGIIAGQAQRRAKDAGFVSAFRVGWIQRVIAQLRIVHEGSVSIRKFHEIEL